MSQHRKTTKISATSLLGGAALAAGMLLAVAPLASADTGVNGRPSSGPAPQPGVDAVQTAGDKVFESNITVPSLSLTGGPVALSNTSIGHTYHALYGNATNSKELDGDGNQVGPRQGLTIGVVNSFATGYNVQCNIVVQTACGAP